MQNIAFEICERVGEAQALIHDQCGKHTAEEVVARLRDIAEEPRQVQLTYAGVDLTLGRILPEFGALRP